MVQQYVDDYYLPSAVRAGRLVSNDAVRARRLATSLERVAQAWPSVEVQVLGVARDGDVIAVDVAVSHPGLGAGDLIVDVWVLSAHADPYPVAAHRTDEGSIVSSGAVYRAMLASKGLEGAEVAGRALPRVEDAPSRFLPGLIAWSSRARLVSGPT
jgi:hypothetical protein